MNKFSIFIALFVASHVCLAQNGYNYQRPEGPSTVAPLRPGSQGTFGTSPAFPSPSSAFPTGGAAATTPGYGSTGYPSPGRPIGTQFPVGPSGGTGGFPGQVDTGVTPSGPGFPSTPGVGGAPGYTGSPSGRQDFGGRPGAPGTGPSGPTGPTGPIGQPTGFPTGAGNTGAGRPGFPGTGPSTPIGPSGVGFPGGRQSTQFPGAGGVTSSGQFGGQQDDGSYDGDYSAIPGEPGQDYPIYAEIPKTSFDCNQQQYPGYYADVEAQCQVFHICALNRTYDFLCPNGTIFSQEHLVCVWWNQFDCQSAPSLYGNNAYIYDYSQTGQQRVGDFRGNQGAIGTVGIPSGQGVQPSTSFPGGSQRPGSTPAGGFPSTGRPTGPSASYSGATGPQGPPTNYPGATGPQGPSTSYPGATGPQGPSSNYPGATGPQGPGGNYPGATGPQGQSGNYPGATGPQGPSANYPGSTGPQGPSTAYPGATGPQGPSTNYPGATGSGQTPGFPGSTSAPGFPGSPSSSSGSSSGFPSTARPGFPIQGESQFPAVTPQAPTREYLPPRRS